MKRSEFVRLLMKHLPNEDPEIALDGDGEGEIIITVEDSEGDKSEVTRGFYALEIYVNVYPLKDKDGTNYLILQTD